MNEDIFEKVNECLERYLGGEEFFDALDDMMKFYESVLGQFIEKARCVYGNCPTIASGEFALCLHNYGIDFDIAVQGGLRKGNKILDLSNFIEPGESYVFLDDSYFSGKTAEVIKEEVERCGGIFYKCFVIYDGSNRPIHNVDSLYRYYTYHDILGRKIKEV